MTKSGLKASIRSAACSRLSGARKVVKADQQRRACGTQPGQLRRLGLLGRLDFEVDNLAAGLGGLGQDVEFRCERPVEVAAMFLAPAGGNGGHVAVFGEELLEVRQRQPPAWAANPDGIRGISSP